MLLGSQTTPWVCATPAAGRRRPATRRPRTRAACRRRHRRAVQHRDRIQAVLSHQDADPATTGDGGCQFVLPDPSAADRQRDVATDDRPNSCFQPYVAGTTPAASVAVDHHHRRRDGAVHRARRARHDRTAASTTSPCCSTRPSRPGRRPRRSRSGTARCVYTFGASTGQPRQQFRTEQNWADDTRAVARLHGRRQQPHRLALQLEPRR